MLFSIDVSSLITLSGSMVEGVCEITVFSNSLGLYQAVESKSHNTQV